MSAAVGLIYFCLRVYDNGRSFVKKSEKLGFRVIMKVVVCCRYSPHEHANYWLTVDDALITVKLFTLAYGKEIITDYRMLNYRYSVIGVWSICLRYS